MKLPEVGRWSIGVKTAVAAGALAVVATGGAVIGPMAATAHHGTPANSNSTHATTHPSPNPHSSYGHCVSGNAHSTASPRPRPTTGCTNTNRPSPKPSHTHTGKPGDASVSGHRPNVVPR